MRAWRWSLALVLALLAPAAADAEEQEVDLELVLAVDVSGSMDWDEQELQRRGYAEALTHPEVLGAIAQGFYGRIAVAYVEWAGITTPLLSVPWLVVEGEDSGRAFADAVADLPPARIRGTSISKALLFAAPLFEANGFRGLRRVIDVSGDGPNNMGPPVLPARDAALAAGITINGLPVMLKGGGFGSIPNLDVYYEECVIGGPGSFVIPVTAADQFPDAIRRKLLLEIAGSAPRPQPAGFAPAQVSRIDCEIGVALRRQWELDR